MKEYLVLYLESAGDEHVKHKIAYAPNADESYIGVPDSSNPVLWGLAEECQIIATIGIPDLAVETVRDLDLWIDEQEIIFE